ncbi:MAG: hypothetical protein R3208_17170 [Ketobacteraceae bacterium]|nr:hypothetical protein [Ketobacteraceae bacterium]
MVTRLSSSALGLFAPLLLCSMTGCASQDQADPEHNNRYIVGFVSLEVHDEALQQRDATLASWRQVSGAGSIHYLRTVTDKAWVVRMEGTEPDKFINALQQLDTVQYVEKDQIIRISPIEKQPSGSPVRVY